jgi:hypothetical protein
MSLPQPVNPSLFDSPLRRLAAERLGGKTMQDIVREVRKRRYPRKRKEKSESEGINILDRAG